MSTLIIEEVLKTVIKMGLIGCVSLDIKKRSVEDLWENLSSSLSSANGITPIAMGIVFETYDVMIFLWCETPENLNDYIINRLRSVKGVTETEVFFVNDMQEITHEEIDSEPGIDGIIFIDVECGKDESVYNAIIEDISPEENKTFTKFVAKCLHSTNLDQLVGFKGVNLYYLDQLFSKVRMVNGVTDMQIMMFSRFTTLVEFDELKKRFPWFL